MVAYITYDEYIALGGKADASAFDTTYKKAQRLLDLWTFDRIKALDEIPEEVKECLTEMINQMQNWEDGANVASFSNGKVSFTFDNSKTQEQDLFNSTAYVYLPVSLISEVVE